MHGFSIFGAGRAGRAGRLWLIGLIVAVLSALPARASDRIALVVGNAAYKTIGALDNPVNDAKLIAGKLEAIGFQVIYVTDANQTDFKRAISNFGRQLRQAGPNATGLFYYAGHGVQSFGSNYLLPVDTELTDAADLPLVAIEADSILRQMHSAKNRTNIVILDACRNNPFVGVPNFTQNGLAEMSAPTGSFLAYATAPGDVAYDGQEGNSPYTRALADALDTPGLQIEQLFKQVRVAVLDKTGGKQTPWDTSSLTRNFQFVPAKPEPVQVRDTEQELWISVRDTRDPVQIALFLRAYPQGRFAAEAQALLVEVAVGPTTRPTPPPPSGPSAEEEAMIQRAQAAGTVEAYREYLDAFPDGAFVTLAQSEIAALATNTGHDPDSDGLSADGPVQASASAPATAIMEVTFLGPIQDPGGAADGRSLAELIRGTPAYPPIEGLPESLWKNQTCSNCHQWDLGTLCKQATTYVTRGITGLERIPHPYGGGFKKALAHWAKRDCPER